MFSQSFQILKFHLYQYIIRNQSQIDVRRKKLRDFQKVL